ncbi:MAG TPA: transposase [Dyadobacter sp.]|jgi:transposase-like protein|nr:transposase [Dyadobacter sp.]
MRPEDLLTDEFLKQFKSRDTLNDFLGKLQKRGIEKMLEGELDGHLGYDRHEQSTNTNSRNGYGKKRVKTSYGESEIRIPRDRGASFNPMIVPKRENMVEGIEEVIVSLYAKGMSVADIEDQIRDVYDFEVSTSTISRITSRIAEDIVSWQNRPLEPVYLIVWTGRPRCPGSSSKYTKTARWLTRQSTLLLGLNAMVTKKS